MTPPAVNAGGRKHIPVRTMSSITASARTGAFGAPGKFRRSARAVSTSGRGGQATVNWNRAKRTSSSQPKQLPAKSEKSRCPSHEPGVERDRVGLLPLPARNEGGEGRGEGNSNKDGLLSPALSSFVPQEEKEKSSVHGPKACAKAKGGFP